MILVRAVHEPWNTHRRLSKISSSTLRNRQPHPVHTDDDIDNPDDTDDDVNDSDESE